MNKELIEILKSIRTWSITETKCMGGLGDLGIATKCDFRCGVCPIFQCDSNKIYSHQLISISLN